MFRQIVFVLSALLCVAGNKTATGEEEKRLWKPADDEVYLQEVGRQIKTDKPVLSLAVSDGELYAGFEDGIRVLDGSALSECDAPAIAAREMIGFGNALYLITDNAVHRLQEGKWRILAEGEYGDVCPHLGKACAADKSGLYFVEGDSLVPIPGADGISGEIRGITSYSESIYCLTSSGLSIFSNGAFDDENVLDWGIPIAGEIRDILAIGSRLFLATNDGLGVIRGMAITHIRGEDGLCYEDTTCLSEGFDGDLWIGTPEGAIRMTGGEFHYFAGKRWLPNDTVRDITCDGHTVYIATDGGIGIIEYQPYTLLKKAAYYERWLEEWGQKRLGFTHKLEWDDPTGQWMREVSDNDGGWTAHYLGAQCFKYAVTGDETARAEAVSSFNALKWCEEISSIDGFPARSIWAVGETGHKAQGGSGGFPAEWHPTPDGLWEWKADTSSDETDAHFYATSIFHDLVAQGKEKERAKEHLWRIASHIIDNGWILRDVDGKPTVWARWDPEYFSSERGVHARGLNGLEVLSYMKTAHTLTGDAKFDEAYKKLIGMGYLEKVIRQKLIDPPGEGSHPDNVLLRELVLPLDAICHPDDRLAFFNYYTMLQYATDPGLRSVYRRSLERSWAVERIEHNPWFNFIYGVLTGNDCEVEQAVKLMREWPLDMVKYTYRNSHRHDLATPPGYVPYSGGTRAISPRESKTRVWSGSGLEHDGGTGGREVVDPSCWIESYWMGRYYGFIKPPEVEDEELLTVKHRGLQLGAAPYDGPPRPEVE